LEQAQLFMNKREVTGEDIERIETTVEFDFIRQATYNAQAEAAEDSRNWEPLFQESYTLLLVAWRSGGSAGIGVRYDGNSEPNSG
jgi:hypothetical protein